MAKYILQNFPSLEVQVSIPTMYYLLGESSQRFQSCSLATEYENIKNISLKNINDCAFKIQNFWALKY